MSDADDTRIASITEMGTCGCCVRRSVLIRDAGICYRCSRVFGLRNALLTVRIRTDRRWALQAFGFLRPEIQEKFVEVFGFDPRILRIVSRS